MRPGFRDYEHLLRLAALFAGGILVFLAAQAVLVPADFGKYGHYRASALDAAASKPVRHAGAPACAACHEDVVSAGASGSHARVRCESCHGPNAAHAAGERKATVPDARTLCARCHERNPARPPSFPQVVGAEHSAGEGCTTCHQPHSPGMS